MMKTKDGHELMVDDGITWNSKDYIVTRVFPKYIVCSEITEDGSIDRTKETIITAEDALTIDYEDNI